jgi:general secretion pathway protein K
MWPNVRRSERGFALVAVVICVAALSLIVAAVGQAAHGHVTAAAATLQRVKISAALDGALTTTAARLANRSTPAGFSSSGESFTVDGTAITVSVRPEAAKIDLNAAPAETITDLLRVVGVNADRAAKLTAAISDWRDSDSFASPDGAEAAEYINAGRAYVPANGNFESTAELALVLGADETLVRCLAQDVTVFTNYKSVDADYSSAHVRAALRLGDASAAPEARDAITVQPGIILELTARAAPKDGAVISRQAILRFTGNPARPVWVLATITPAPDAAASDAACKAFAASESSP